MAFLPGELVNVRKGMTGKNQFHSEEKAKPATKQARFLREGARPSDSIESGQMKGIRFCSRNRKQNELRALAGATFRGLGERVRAFSSFRSWAVERATR